MSTVQLRATPSASARMADSEGNSVLAINVFISFNLFGLFGTLIMVLTVMFSRYISRHSTWFSFAFSWIISTTSYSLLFFAGRLTGAQPDYGLCLMQSIMIYSAPPLTASTTLALVIHIWLIVRSTLTKDAISTKPRYWLPTLLITPYIIYITILIAGLAFGAANPNTIRRVSTGMYCNSSNRIPGRISTLLVTLMLIPAVALEVLICSALYKNWSVLRGNPGSCSLSMILRVLCFACFGIMAIVLSTILFFSVHGPVLNIVLSIIPVAVVFIFASQEDILRIWMFWRRPRPVEHIGSAGAYLNKPAGTSSA